MTYVLAWLAIGFICAVLSYGYNTEKVFNYKIQEYLTRTGGKNKEVFEQVQYEKYRMLTFVLIIIYGVFGIISYYSIRNTYFKTL